MPHCAMKMARKLPREEVEVMINDTKESSGQEDDDGEKSATPTPPPSPPRTRKKARAEEAKKQEAEVNDEVDDDEEDDLFERVPVYRCKLCPGKKFLAEEIKVHRRVFHKLKDALKEKLNPVPRAEGERVPENVAQKKEAKAKASERNVDTIKLKEFKIKVNDILKQKTKKGKPKKEAAETPRPSSGKKVEGQSLLKSGGTKVQPTDDEKEERAEIQKIASLARLTSVYRCKKCPEEVLFTEEKRDRHHRRFHKDSKTYDVDRHQEDHVVVLCMKCPHVVIPLSEWDQHLHHHKLSRMFSVRSLE